MLSIRFFSKVVFTPEQLMKVVKVKRKGWLYRAGGYLRTAAKKRIKEVNKSSDLEDFTFVNEFGREQHEKIWRKAPVNHPPYDHLGFKRTFHFGVNENAEVVDVGALSGKHKIPPLHEFGGSGVIKYQVYDKRGNIYTRTKTHFFQKRETMRPALEASKKTISTFWKGVVTSI